MLCTAEQASGPDVLARQPEDRQGNTWRRCAMFPDESAVLRRAVRDMLDADDRMLPDPDEFRVGEDDE